MKTLNGNFVSNVLIQIFHKIALLILLIFSILAATSVLSEDTFYEQEGFEDDVDLIVAENQEFLLVPVEEEDGSPAFLRIYDLDAMGDVIGLSDWSSVLGWENGVDPIVINVEGNQMVAVPTETEDGTSAEVWVLIVNSAGVVIDWAEIVLDDLGFEDDVDPVGIYYVQNGFMIPLETETGDAAGVLGIKLTPAADFGLCTLVASDARDTVCDDLVDDTGLLTGFVDGLDGVAYTLVDRARFAIPTQPEDASSSDLVFFDWDFGTPVGSAPHYMGATSVKALNEGGANPLPFPGFEREVDIGLMEDCLGGLELLVPVEYPTGDQGDLYLVNGETGIAIWRYELENVPGVEPQIIGYEEGVDIVPWCNLGIEPDDLVVVPTEKICDADADVFLVNMATGALYESVERFNPPLEIIGFEKGVEPLRWDTFTMVVPVDDERGQANLLSISTTGAIVDAVEDPDTNPSLIVLGFERSVDPLTLIPISEPDRTLYVPVENEDQSDANLLIFPGPPPFFAGMISFEAVNPEETVSGYERGVDPIIVDKQEGYCCVYVPEETPDSTSAHLRVKTLLANARLLLPTEGIGAAPAPNLYQVTSAGVIAEESADALGYELGLDPTSYTGDSRVQSPPVPFSLPLGEDADTDNTLTMENSYYGNLDGDALDDTLDCAMREGRVYDSPTEVTGVLLDKTSAGGAIISWDSQDSIVGEDTCYDIAGGLISELKADADYSHASCTVNDCADTPYIDDRDPGVGECFYYLVRAQNLCGTATYGDSSFLPDPRDDLDTATGSPCP